MHSLTATFHVSTPLFIGNAAQQPELLAAPFKRALRFWWRALNYSLVDEREPRYERILEREARLFGRAAREKNDIGRCPFLLRVRLLVPEAGLHRPLGTVLDEAKDRPGLIYLGYGLLNIGRNRPTPIEQGRLERGCLWAEGGFDVSLEMNFSRHQQLSSDSAQELVATIKVFGLLGGIGGRNRRGFGSMSLTRLEIDRVDEGWSAPQTDEHYKAQITAALRGKAKSGDGHPLAYTAFGPDSRVDLMNVRNTHACALLDRLGWTMQRYRSWGRNGKVGGAPRENPFRFDRDHKWYHDWRHAEPRQLPAPTPDLPERAVFGLPQPYTQTLRVIGPKHRGEDIERRASPLFVHVHRIGQKYAVVLAFLPAQFLPEAAVQIVYAGNDVAPERRRFDPNFDKIRDLLDGCHQGGPKDGEPYISDSKSVWP